MSLSYFDDWGWYTTQVLPERTTPLTPKNTSETTVVGELRSNFTGYDWIELPYYAPVVPVEVPEEPV